MPRQFRELQVRQLDETLRRIAAVRDIDPPSRGWLRAIREALGMTQAQVADRLGVTTSMVSKYEQGEVDGSIRLATLRRAATALNAEVVCVVVPASPVAEMRLARARRVAAKHVEAVHRSMALEDQTVSVRERERQVEELAREMLEEPSTLWDDIP